MHILSTPAIVCAIRHHGEHGVIARLFTPDAGLVAGYVRGGRGRAMRPVLIPGNSVMAELRSRNDAQMPGLNVELIASRAMWLGEPLAAAALDWATVLTASALPEGTAYPRLYAALSALIDAICHAPSARGWVQALLAYERLLLRDLGYGDAGAGSLPTQEDWPDLLMRLDRSGRALELHLFNERRRDPVMARRILVDRLKRVVA